MIYPKKTLISFQGYDIPAYLEQYAMKLDTNENILGPSPKAIEVLNTITEEDIKFYPAYGELISEIANYNNISTDFIHPTNGCDEAINYIFDAYIGEGDEILTVKPSFAMPKIYAQSIGCKYKEIDYEVKWEFPVDTFIKNISSATKMIIITTPNNPTGDVISRDNLIKILDNSKHCIVLIDETYTHYTNETFVDIVKDYDNVIITKSMSKDFALAGLRLGYIIAQPYIINEIKKIICPYSVNSVAVKLGIASLKDKEYFNKVKEEVNQSRQLLSEGLKPFAVKVYEGYANFIIADFGEKADFYYTRLLNNGIKIKNFSKNSELSGFLRISVPSIEQTKQILNIFNKNRPLLVFDIDGVIVDTRQSYRLAIKETYEYFSHNVIDFDKIQKAKNQGGLNNDWDLTEFLLKEDGLNIDKSTIINKFQEFYLGNDFNGLILNEDILINPDCFKKLSEKYDLAIFTGRPRQEAEFVLKRWNIDKFFSTMISMDDIPLEKGKPDSFGLEVIKKQTSNDEIYYFGDTPDDIISAVGAGVKGIGILPPQDKSESLIKKMQDKGAYNVLKNTTDIIDFLGAEKYEMQHC